MKYEEHAKAALKAIGVIEEFKFTPQEKIATLRTAASMIGNEVTAAATSMALRKALDSIQ